MVHGRQNLSVSSSYPDAADTLMYFDRRSDDDDATPPPTSFGPSFGMKRGKWRCGAVAPNGKLYCVPHEATRFLCVHPESLEVEEVGQPVLDEDGSKFFGAVTGNDGMLYCCPYSASHVYRFNPMTDLVEKVGADLGDMEKKVSLLRQSFQFWITYLNSLFPLTVQPHGFPPPCRSFRAAAWAPMAILSTLCQTTRHVSIASMCAAAKAPRWALISTLSAASRRANSMAACLARTVRSISSHATLLALFASI